VPPRGQSRSTNEPDDGSLADWINRARRLDPDAWDRLYSLAFPQVYRYIASKIGGGPDAEDLAEEVFLGALQSIGGLRASDETGLLAWLFQIARHKIADYLRRKIRRPTEPLDPDLEVGDPSPTPEQRALSVEEQSVLREALGGLTDEQREVIVMKFALGYDNTRVAALLGKSPGAINQLQHRALGALRRLLNQVAV